MSYTVLARKYRPQTFDDLVGQEHVARTLSNAIAANRIAHAFLFTGVRGVGKTTTARLLAKALNCVKGPAATPCNACAQCQEITAGVDMDVLEMDGASNNSVDDVRRLQESVPYRPARDRFKIVIVDEVHMLSTGAFNAFLKTLEEPPDHVKFILATTESHKVPITVRSRCQRYDFRLIPTAAVAERMRAILAAESIEADQAAIALVAREAAGSMRDALTLLDQVVAFGGKSLRGTEVAQVLGIADRSLVHDAMRALLTSDGTGVLRAVDGLAARGLDMLHFARQLLQLGRDLVVLRVAGAETEWVDLVPEERQDVLAWSAEVDVLELERLFSGIGLVVEEVGRSGAPRTALEMGLVRLATRPKLEAIGTLLAEIEDLGKRIGARSEASPRNERTERITAKPPAPPPLPLAARLSAPTAPSAPLEASRPTERAIPRARPAEARQEAADATPVDLAKWETIVASLRESRPALAAVLAHGSPVTLNATEILLGFPEGSFFGRQADSADARDGIAAAAEPILGSRPRVCVKTVAAATASGPTVAQLDAQRKAEADEATRRRAITHPRVVEAMQVFPEAAGNVDVEIDDH